MNIALLEKMLNAVNALLRRKILIHCDRIPYEFQKVSYKKILNWILVESSIYFKPDKPWGWPTHLQIEPSAVCNLNCAFCPVTTGLKRPTGHMGPATFERIINEVGDYLLLILLWDWGEPFLNPSIYEMIAYAKTRKIKIVSSTNGHVFSRGNHAERLVQSGLDSIIFAVDGISQDTYKKYRRNGDLGKVTAGIKKVVAAKEAFGSETPLINLRFIPMRHNEHEIPKLKEFARSLGVNALSLKTLNPYEQGECHSTQASGKEFVPQDSRYQRFRCDPVTGSRIRLEKNPCKRLWNNPAIHWNGSVSSCTFDPHARFSLGNLNTRSFREIWWGSELGKLRSRFRKNYRDIPLCADCTDAFEGGSCSTDIIPEACFFGQ